MRFTGIFIAIAGVAFWLTVPEYWEDAKIMLNEIHPNLTDIILITLMIIGSLVFVYDYRTRKSENQTNNVEIQSATQEQKEHMIDLMNIYKRICKAVIRDERRNEYEIVFPKQFKEFTSFDAEITNKEFIKSEHWQTDYVSQEYIHNYRDYDYFEDAIKHLEDESYKETYAHLTKTKKLLDEFNKRPKFESKLYETIESKMKVSFPDFKKGTDGDFQNSYDPRVILDVVTNLWFVDRVRFDFLEIRDKYGYPSIITEYGTRAQVSSSDKNKLDLDKYKKLLESLVLDESLKKMMTDETHAFIEIINELDNFQKKLTIIIRNHKHKILRGKCDSCP